MNNSKKIEGFVLAGGKSSRMGEPKAEMQWGGSSFIDRAAASLSAIGGENVFVVGGPIGVAHGLHVFDDILPPMDREARGGAIVGLHTALSVARSDWIALLACDMPFVSREFLEKLYAIDRNGFDAVVPVQQDGTLQPLCALYSCETCLPAVIESMNGGDHSMRSLLKRVNTRFVTFYEFAKLENANRLFFNVNSPEDYKTAKKLLQQQHIGDL